MNLDKECLDAINRNLLEMALAITDPKAESTREEMVYETYKEIVALIEYQVALIEYQVGVVSSDTKETDNA